MSRSFSPCAVLLVSLLPALATGSAYAAAWQLVKTTPDPSGQVTVQPAKSDSYEARTAGVGEYTRTCRNGRENDYNFKASFQAPDTVIQCGAEPTTITLEVTITCTGKYGPGLIANAVKYSGNGVDPKCVELTRDGQSLTPDDVGVWAGNNVGPIVKEASGKFRFTVGPGTPDKFSIYAVSVGIGAVTAWDYEKIQGPLPPTTKPPVTPPTTPDKPAVKPPKPETIKRPPLGLRLDLATAKYDPGEPLVAYLVVSTGLKPGETMGGTAEVEVCEDTTGSELFWGIAAQQTGRAILQTTPVTARTVSARTTSALFSGPLRTFETVSEIPVTAPRQEGDYCLWATVRTDDGRDATASAFFRVDTGFRRLLVWHVRTANVPPGTPCQISLDFSMSGAPAAQCPRPFVRASGEVKASGAKGSGFRIDLPEQEIPMALDGKNEARGSVTWAVTFPRPGNYLVNCQVFAPYYGTRERVATIIVTEKGTRAGGTENLVAGALANVSAGGGGTAAMGGGQAGGTIAGGATLGGGGGTVAGGGSGDGGVFVPAAALAFDLDGGKAVVSTVLPGTYSYRAGIRAGFQLVTIDGKPVDGLTLEQIRTQSSPTADHPFVLLTFLNLEGGTVNLPVSVASR